jgi:hypothetical protein
MTPTGRPASQETTGLRGARLAFAGLLLSAAAVVAAALSGLGYRWGWWSFPQGFKILRWAAWGGLGEMGVALTGGWVARASRTHVGLTLALRGIAAGLCVTTWTSHLARMAKTVPAIHDITTDTERPPTFSAIVPCAPGRRILSTMAGQRLRGRSMLRTQTSSL